MRLRIYIFVLEHVSEKFFLDCVTYFLYIGASFLYLYLCYFHLLFSAYNLFNVTFDIMTTGPGKTTANSPQNLLIVILVISKLSYQLSLLDALIGKQVDAAPIPIRPQLMRPQYPSGPS
jgi:hypothetical protein